MFCKYKGSGIYLIKNIKTRRVYVGSAVDCRTRCRMHHNSLNRGNHHNRFLQNGWLKYGKENYRFIVLEKSKKNDLVTLEQKWINHYFDNQNKCYNLCPIAQSSLGIKRTKETKQKISTFRKNKTWEEIMGHEKAALARINHSKRFSGENNPNYGFCGNKSHWYNKKHSETTKKKMSLSAKNRKPKDNIVKNILRTKARKRLSDPKNHPMYGKRGAFKFPIKATKFDTDFVLFFSSRKEASKVLDLPVSRIANVLHNKSKLADGYFFETISTEDYIKELNGKK